MKKLSMKSLLITLLGYAVLSYSQLSLAAWTLDNAQSQLNFNSTKNDTVTETHRFTELSGHVADNGQASLTVKLASVETKVPLRNERLRDLLFDVKTYPSARFQTKLDPQTLKKLTVGSTITQTIKGTLQLHGQQKPVTAHLQISRPSDKQIVVTTAEPINLNANDFKLGPGIEKLREIMSLKKIDWNIPLSFRLIFNASST
jgi:polyisoprenoid-binding protein YceI